MWTVGVNNVNGECEQAWTGVRTGRVQRFRVSAESYLRAGVNGGGVHMGWTGCAGGVNRCVNRGIHRGVKRGVSSGCGRMSARRRTGECRSEVE